MIEETNGPNSEQSRFSRRDFLKIAGISAVGSAFPSGLSGLLNNDSATGPLIVDAHIDLGWNIINYRRDYTRSALITRSLEVGKATERVAGRCMVGLPEWLQGRVALLCGSMFVMPRRAVTSGLQLANYQTPHEAHQWAWQMLKAIDRLTSAGPTIVPVRTVMELDNVLASWAPPASSGQVGVILSIEGADPIETPDQLHIWYERGLRMIGLSWLRTRYAGGNDEPSGLTDLGKQLLQEMKRIGIIFDTAHLAEEAYWDSLKIWEGPFVCSHGNARHFLPSQRALSDDQIKALAKHKGVMGIGLYNGFYLLHRHSSVRPDVQDVANAIDYVCQLLGSSEYVAIGSDFDGGFGAEAAPAGLDTSADLLKIPAALRARGYSTDQVDAITHGNWLRIFRQVLPPA